ncbi:hypothetical protein MKX01_020913 [Papaver californicum]|nr:hypothetical protein MKX01_020913 [Papaver californicum]
MGLMIKDLIESTDLISVPSKHALPAKAEDLTMLTEEEEEGVEQVSLPVIDFSLLTSGSADQRSKVIEDLGNACLHWGFFMFERRIDQLLYEFLRLDSEEKCVYEVENAVDPCILDPIIYGTNFNPASESVSFWRDYLRALVHPVFHSPPRTEVEVLSEYSKRSRDVTKELLKAIMEGLELEEDDIEKSLELKSGVQLFSANLYPPCPHPELAIGLPPPPPHADYGLLLTLLMQNNVGGLQLKIKGKWVAVNAIPNCIMLCSVARFRPLLHHSPHKKRQNINEKKFLEGPDHKFVSRTQVYSHNLVIILLLLQLIYYISVEFLSSE